MGKSEKIYDNMMKECQRKYKLELIHKNLLYNYERILKNENIKSVIKNQKQFVVAMDLPGKYKNRHSSILLLEQYKNAKNKTQAFEQLTNSMRNKKIFKIE
jgi:hypothetical protein